MVYNSKFYFTGTCSLQYTLMIRDAFAFAFVFYFYKKKKDKLMKKKESSSQPVTAYDKMLFRSIYYSV